MTISSDGSTSVPSEMGSPSQPMTPIVHMTPTITQSSGSTTPTPRAEGEEQHDHHEREARGRQHGEVAAHERERVHLQVRDAGQVELLGTAGPDLGDQRLELRVDATRGVVVVRASSSKNTLIGGTAAVGGDQVAGEERIVLDARAQRLARLRRRSGSPESGAAGSGRRRSDRGRW